MAINFLSQLLCIIICDKYDGIRPRCPTVDTIPHIHVYVSTERPSASTNSIYIKWVFEINCVGNLRRKEGTGRRERKRNQLQILSTQTNSIKNRVFHQIKSHQPATIREDSRKSCRANKTKNSKSCATNANEDDDDKWTFSTDNDDDDDDVVNVDNDVEWRASDSCQEFRSNFVRTTHDRPQCECYTQLHWTDARVYVFTYLIYIHSGSHSRSRTHTHTYSNNGIDNDMYV